MKYFIRFIVLIPLVFLVISCNESPVLEGSRPNIIFIIADDIGYSDLGCFGSEIETPSLDKLASEGLRFRQFYNMAKCNPTRSSLHTGMFYGDSESPSLGENMSAADYNTLFVGKEHFDEWVPKNCYAANSFDRSITFWAMNNYFLQDDGTYPNKYAIDGKEVRPEEIPSHGEEWFLSDVLTYNAIDLLEEYSADDKPFFLYLGFLNAHYPLQAKQVDIEKYRGKYMEGWDELRVRRFKKQKELGLMEEDWELSPPSSNVNRFRGHPKGDEEIREKIPYYTEWEGLTDSAKVAYDLEMSVFAALVDNLDQNIARLLEYLEQSRQIDNTLIVFMSDNGSCPYDSNRDFLLPPGHSQSFRTLDPKWANLGNTPYRFYKQYGHEGGANTHFIAWWPGKINEGQIIQQTGHVVDIMPTFLDLAGNPLSDSFSIDGLSLLPLFEGSKRKDHPYMLSGLDKFRMYREGNYKLVRVNGEKWELYNIEVDPTELNDLAESQRGIVLDMEKRYLERVESRK
ncbi:MAG: sulfatase-like hydrolase/transferase [Bacteroidales bacterium]|jgi:arylsulfatase A-like enzyme|nr:sulfatase-like hydrolase/transferase [Bacteroidales bacterium]